MTEQALAASLAPVRDALLARARADAEAALGAADDRVAEVTGAAEAEASALLAEAREQGSADAALVAAAERARARREGRALVLGAQRAACEELRLRCVTEVGRLREDPSYAQLRERLGREATALLGTGAAVVDDPAGGVLATAAGRTLDLSLPTVAARAVEGLGHRVATLWEP